MWRNHLEEVIIALHRKSEDSYEYDIKQACIECIEIIQEVKISGVLEPLIWDRAIDLINKKCQECPEEAQRIYELTKKALSVVLDTYQTH